jgi:DNA repair exonuclease SbcCD ATPase subunit
MIANGIRIRALRLRGFSRDYELSFAQDDGVRPFSVIAGEISTGKSSVLEFCDYCLGASIHPMHEEFRRAGIWLALLEVLLDGDLYVIERSVFSSDQSPRVHACGLDKLDEPHEVEVRPLKPAGADNSLSNLLLGSFGMSGALLKEAPTQDASGVDPLSFRDVMSLCFVSNERLGSRTMLHESEPPKAIKMKQVIDLVFGIDDQALTNLSSQLQRKERERAEADKEAITLSRFLDEALPALDAADLDPVAKARSDLRDLEDQLGAIDAEMRARTGFAESLRSRYSQAATDARVASARVRDRETLLRRLLALRGQYVADIARLHFFGESRLLFDPLAVRVCPACHSDLPEAPKVTDRRCSLCGQQVEPTEEDVDTRREIRLTEARLSELDRYVGEVEAQIRKEKAQLVEASAQEGSLQRDLDGQVAASVAPFVVQRDNLMRARQALSVSLQRLEQARGLRASAHKRVEDADRLSGEIKDLRIEIARLREEQPTRDSLTEALTNRFLAILSDFKYPKLHGVSIDDRYSPQVRGLGYTHLSSGARTLVGVAWHLALLEEAVETGSPHPRLLMLDGIQKNLRPVQSGDQDPDFQRPEIVAAIYDHVARWAEGAGANAQLIVVDNAPPPGARKYVAVEFSADPNRPPYGFIDDIID